MENDKESLNISPLQIRLSDDEKRLLKIEAAKRDMTMTRLVKQAIVFYLKNCNK